MKTLYASFTGEHWQINFHQDGRHAKLAGKQNNFRTKTDAENCIRSMVKANPKQYKFNEQ